MSVRSLSTSNISNNQPRYGRMSAISGSQPYFSNFLIVGGGGGGNGYVPGLTWAAGGGGGEAIEKSVSLPIGTHSLSVGAGGSAGSPGSSSVFYSFTSVGGQHGASETEAGEGGRSGNRFPGGRRTGGGDRAGGGGGATGAGLNGVPGSAGAGGPGLASSITGSSVTYSAGGGGGSNFTAAGAANTGTGGAGSSSGVAGGSGIVVFRVPLQANVTFSGGVTQTSTVSGAVRIYTVTAAGPTDTFTIS